MKPTVVCISLLTIVAAVVRSASTVESPEQMIGAAKALDKQTVDAFNKRDVDAIMATYWKSPDLVCYPYGVLEIRGWDAVKSDVVETFSTMPAGVTVETVETNYKVAGDVVITWGKWRTRMVSSNGQSSTLEGRGMGVVAKRDGKWVYVLDHTSVPYGATPKPSSEQ